MGRGKKFDHAEFKRMWEAGTPGHEIAEHFGCSESWVCQTVPRLNLQRREKRRKDIKAPERPPPPDGGYARVAEIAARDGCTWTHALQRFHRSRV